MTLSIEQARETMRRFDLHYEVSAEEAVTANAFIEGWDAAIKSAVREVDVLHMDESYIPPVRYVLRLAKACVSALSPASNVSTQSKEEPSK